MGEVSETGWCLEYFKLWTLSELQDSVILSWINIFFFSLPYIHKVNNSGNKNPSKYIFLDMKKWYLKGCAVHELILSRLKMKYVKYDTDF